MVVGDFMGEKVNFSFIKNNFLMKLKRKITNNIIFKM